MALEKSPRRSLRSAQEPPPYGLRPTAHRPPQTQKHSSLMSTRGLPPLPRAAQPRLRPCKNTNASR
eukprot:2869449-Prymnesium_polylepis.1